MSRGKDTFSSLFRALLSIDAQELDCETVIWTLEDSIRERHLGSHSTPGAAPPQGRNPVYDSFDTAGSLSGVRFWTVLTRVRPSSIAAIAQTEASGENNWSGHPFHSLHEPSCFPLSVSIAKVTRAPQFDACNNGFAVPLFGKRMGRSPSRALIPKYVRVALRLALPSHL
jgi:hypothetical protein